MDRRQLLFGMATLGLARRLSLNDLLSAQVVETATRPRTMSDSQVSDRERDGLRGPVKECIDEGSVTEYDYEGHRLSWRTKNFGASEWGNTWTYDSAGRLQKATLGNSNGSSTEQLYSYDEAGRLQGITDSRGDRTVFHYDEQSRKIGVQSLAPRPDAPQDFAVSEGALFESVEAGEGVSEGGFITTRYNERDQPEEVEVRDTEGYVLSRIVRSYDGKGRLGSEKLISENVDISFAKRLFAQVPEELRTDVDLKQVREQISEGFKAMNPGSEKSYEYDAQNRVTKIVTQTGFMGMKTTTTYNEHGDIIEESRTYSKTASSFPFGVSLRRDENGKLAPDKPESEWPPQPDLPEPYAIHYAYQHDSYGNWTEQTTIFPGSNEPFTRYRQLTYY